MPEEEHYEWRIFYPLISNNENIRAEKNFLIAPFTLTTKLNMLSITDEKRSHHSSCIDIYFPLRTVDVCLKVHDIEKLHNSKIEIEIRNRHKEQQSSFIQHWSIYEIKHPRFDLPDKVLSRLDHLTVEQINKYLQIIINEQDLTNRSDLSCIKMQKNADIWQMDDSDRQLEETDIYLLINDDDDSSKEKNNFLYIPTHWRTISIQTGDNEKLLKTLTTLQIENDKDFLDYFSFLISQTHFKSLSRHHQQQSLLTLTSEKAYINLLTMSYAAFCELIQRIHTDQSYTQSIGD